MTQSFNATASIEINATPERVWDALTDPKQVKQYFFGTTLTAEWKAGGKITYSGEWQGKSYEDKGRVLQIEPRKFLKMTHFSPLSGKEDKPENYHTITYTLAKTDNGTELTITQDNNPDRNAMEHSQKNWVMMLENLKKFLEK